MILDTDCEFTNFSANSSFISDLRASFTVLAGPKCRFENVVPTFHIRFVRWLTDPFFFWSCRDSFRPVAESSLQ